MYVRSKFVAKIGTTMKKNETTPSTLKEVLSFKCSVEFKHQILQEAKALGISKSELLYSKVQMYSALEKENSSTKKELTHVRNQITAMQSQFLEHGAQAQAFVNELRKDYDDVLRLNGELQIWKDLSQNPQLLQIFLKLKGRIEELVDQNGKKSEIKIDSPADLLKVMINSFKIKKDEQIS
jgi:hypothetical protein